MLYQRLNSIPLGLTPDIVNSIVHNKPSSEAQMIKVLMQVYEIDTGKKSSNNTVKGLPQPPP